MHRTYLADIERGKRNISLSSIVKLVRALGVTLPEFFQALEEPPDETVAPAKVARKKTVHRGGGRPWGDGTSLGVPRRGLAILATGPERYGLSLLMFAFSKLSKSNPD